jgi:hypothetical protein
MYPDNRGRSRRVLPVSLAIFVQLFEVFWEITMGVDHVNKPAIAIDKYINSYINSSISWQCDKDESTENRNRTQFLNN